MTNRGEALAGRLEKVYQELAALIGRPGAAEKMHAGAGEEWSAMQVLGHMVEIVPYWLDDCRAMIAAEEGDPPHFGRDADDPDRLAGINLAQTEDPEALLGRFGEEVRAAGETIRRLAPDDWQRTGLSQGTRVMTVAQVIEWYIVAHAEDHLEQLKAALSR